MKTKAVKKKASAPHAQTKQSLCNTCRFATARHCSWIGRGDKTGIKVVEWARNTNYHKKQDKRIITSGCVVECERYQEGPLPPF